MGVCVRPRFALTMSSMQRRPGCVGLTRSLAAAAGAAVVTRTPTTVMQPAMGWSLRPRRLSVGPLATSSNRRWLSTARSAPPAQPTSGSLLLDDTPRSALLKMLPVSRLATRRLNEATTAGVTESAALLHGTCEPGVGVTGSLSSKSTAAERASLIRAIHQRHFGGGRSNNSTSNNNYTVGSPTRIIEARTPQLQVLSAVGDNNKSDQREGQHERKKRRRWISKKSPSAFNGPNSMLFNAYAWSAATGTRAVSSSFGDGPLSYDTTATTSSSASASTTSSSSTKASEKKKKAAKSKRASATSSLSWNTVFRAMAGNTVIFFLKIGAWLSTGSGAMFSEAVHTLADCGNQALLLAGLSQASHAPDSRYQYGYGKAAYFWALVSALGMFWTGAGVSISQGFYHLLHPPEVFGGHEVVLGVLLMSFAVDGYVLVKTLQEIQLIKPKDMTLWRYMVNIRDPFLLAVVLEDAAACTGVLLAATGIGMTYATGDVFWDSAASISIGALLAMVALRLARVNQQFLMGQAVDKEIINDIREMIAQRSTIDNVYSVKSQWISPNTFAFKAEVDFNGPKLAQSLHRYYTPLFCSTPDEAETAEFLNWFAEDVTTLVELEVQAIEALIQSKYPGAAYVELEPDSKNVKMRSVTNDPQTVHTMNIITRGSAGSGSGTASAGDTDSDEEDDADDAKQGSSEEKTGSEGISGGGGGGDAKGQGEGQAPPQDEMVMSVEEHSHEQIMNSGGASADDVYRDVKELSDIDSLANAAASGDDDDDRTTKGSSTSEGKGKGDKGVW